MSNVEVMSDRNNNKKEWNTPVLFELKVNKTFGGTGGPWMEDDWMVENPNDMVPS